MLSPHDKKVVAQKKKLRAAEKRLASFLAYIDEEVERREKAVAKAAEKLQDLEFDAVSHHRSR